MPGPAFHFEVLDLAAKQLAGGGAADAAKAKVLTDHREYAHLGALGPDILRYMPVDTKAIDTLTQKDVKALTPAELKALALQVQPSPVMSLYGVLFRLLVPLLPSFVEIDALLEEMADIAAAEDVDRLKNAKAEFDAIKPKIDALKAWSAARTRVSRRGARSPVLLGKPLIQADLPGLRGTSQFWRPFELLRWKRTAPSPATCSRRPARRAIHSFWRTLTAISSTSRRRHRRAVRQLDRRRALSHPLVAQPVGPQPCRSVDLRAIRDAGQDGGRRADAAVR